jgi:hypothetical protein
VNKDPSFDSVSLFDCRIPKLHRTLWRKFPEIDWENERAIVFGTKLNSRCEFLQELLILSADRSPSDHTTTSSIHCTAPARPLRQSTWVL